MPIVNLTNEKLAANDVVRSNWTSVANAVAEYADARYGNRVSWNVLARRHERLRRSRQDTAMRNLWAAIIFGTTGESRLLLRRHPREEGARWSRAFPLLQNWVKACCAVV